jgi:hypothetical protein
MRGTALFAVVVPLVARDEPYVLTSSPLASMGENLLFLLLWGGSVYVCYTQAKKKGRNTSLAIVLGLFLNWFAVIGYLVIRALPDPSVAPSDRLAAAPDLALGDRSVRAGSIGVVVALLSSLVVWGLNRTLTGGEGDLGPGTAMLGVGVGALVAVSYLGVAAIWRGFSSLRKAREVGRPMRARIGIALGVLDLCAAVGSLVAVASMID